jgi:eukaryotic-like serine/threonine-protein kinase
MAQTRTPGENRLITHDRWQRIKDLFREALERDVNRNAFLAEVCGTDEALRREVETLLRAHDDPETLFRIPPYLPGGEEYGPPASHLEGVRLGAYTIVREISSGGMGTVCLGVRNDDVYTKHVAIKLLRRGFRSDHVIRRFRTERQILASLEHQNIARLLDGGATEDGLPYLVMEYVKGMPIDTYCDQRRMSVRERLELFLQVCAAVHYAHQHLVIHRDIKPANILVTDEGAVRLLDFGIAKLLAPDSASVAEATEPVLRLMTPEYASPEQIRGENITTASDVYSLGVVLYRLLTGHRPFPAALGRESKLESAICGTDPERPSAAINRVEDESGPDGPVHLDAATVSAARRETARSLYDRIEGDLDNVIMMALRKEPAQRYNSAQQLADDIRRHLNGYPVVAHSESARYRFSKCVRRNRVAVGAVTVGVCSLIAGVAGTAWQAHVAHIERARAERRFEDVRQMANSFLFEFHDSIQNLAGATPARELIVRRALEYLNSLAQEADNDLGLLRELAAAYEKIGAVQGGPSRANLGDTAGALKSQQAALALRKRINSQLSGDRTAELELSVSCDRVGDLFWAMGAQSEALENYRAALAIRERLWRADPEDRSLAHHLTSSYLNIGDLQFEAKQSIESVASFRKALAVAEDAVRRHPGDAQALRDLSVACNRIGDSHWYASDFRRALESYTRAAEIRMKLVAANPSNAVLRRDLIACYNNIGDTLIEMGRAPAAVENYRKSLAIAESLASADPGNALAARDYAICQKHLAAALLRLGERQEACRSLAAALTILQEQQRKDPANAVLAKDISEVTGLAQAEPLCRKQESPGGSGP